MVRRALSADGPLAYLREVAVFRRRWHVISVEMHPWPRCSDNRRFVSKHWSRWLAKQAKTTYDEHEAERIVPTLPAGYVRTEYRIERAYP